MTVMIIGITQEGAWKKMKGIPLTQGKVAVVDEEDYPELIKHRWYASRKGRTIYARRDIRRAGVRRTIYMHRQIMNPLPGFEIHHINHNGLANRRANLCLCTHSQHSRSQRPRKNGSSRYKGVFRYKRNGKWCAQIKQNKRRIHLGVFTSQVRAAKAYDDRVAELFGEFAYLNFPHRLSRRNICRWLMATHGRMFAVTFIRRSDNKEKTIKARIGVKIHQKGKAMRYDPRNKKLVLVFDMSERKYKCIPIEGIEAVTYNGKRYRVD